MYTIIFSEYHLNTSSFCSSGIVIFKHAAIFILSTHRKHKLYMRLIANGYKQVIHMCLTVDMRLITMSKTCLVPQLPY